MSSTAAIIATVLLAGLALFQAALASGAELGRFAWGGHHDVLPTGFRIASGVAVLIYVVMAVIILDRAGTISVLQDDTARIATWVIAGYLAVGVVLNLISRSKSERNVMAPLALVLAMLALIVAAGW